jgi:hypothetical protein
MSFSYSGDPSDSDLDAIRFYVQDTDTADALIQDEEIQFLIDTWYPLSNSLIYIAAVTAEVIASKFAREVSSSADGVSVSSDQLQAKYQSLAEQLRDQYTREVSASSGVSFTSDMWDLQHDPSIKPLSFSIGMDDNPLGGAQPPPRGSATNDDYYYGR